MKAYEICKDNPPLPEHQIELFKFSGGEINLRIPENLLTPHFKFNKYGVIENRELS